MKNISFVTGIWDIKRDHLSDNWSRPFEHYINNFINLLRDLSEFNLIIFIDPEHESLIWKYRSPENTKIYHITTKNFENNFFPFFHQVQNIRNNPEWYNKVEWLKESTQGSLEYYNPVVMSKMFLLHDAKIFDPFNSNYFFWIDGGITNTLSLGYFKNPDVIDNLINLSSNFLFIAFPYSTDSEIHGFDINGMKRYSKSDTVNRVARGGFFGGNKNAISKANQDYYSLLDDTLHENLMGTEESIFTIMTYIDPTFYHFEMINSDGLIYTFFENLQQKNKPISRNSKNINTYIITFNSPQQLQMVLDSFEKYESNILKETNLIVINNSTNNSLFNEYENIVKKYNINEIRKNNIGICGGRQFIAEHFDSSQADYMFFFEDDMLLDFENECSFGFKKNTPNLYNNLISIMKKENFDFLKLSFSEFYGHNGEQWSWHNVPEAQRIDYFGILNSKPLTKFKNIKTFNSLPYADGEIYYSNWPHIISKDGNKKCFLDTKWTYPYEQTWMSHIYTLTKEDKVRPAILLVSPITHNRIHHYGANERKEN